MTDASLSSNPTTPARRSAPAAPHLSTDQWVAGYGRVPGLDGLRCFSILVVLIGHFVLPTSLIGVSAFGVKVFFFISGFLISRLMFAEYKNTSELHLSAFYVRRILRLYPVILVYILIVAPMIYFADGAYSINELASVFFYYVNYLEVQRSIEGPGLLYPIGVLWSLSVEEHFYLLAPFAFVFLRADPRRILLLCLAICVLCLGVRLYYATAMPEVLKTNLIYKHSETRFDSIAYGVLLACVAELEAGRRLLRYLCNRWAFMMGCLGIILSFAIRDAYFQNTFRFTIQGLMLLPIVASLVFSAPIPILNRLLNLGPVVWVGMLSYSLYVWHGGVDFFFGSLLDRLPGYGVGYAEIVLTFLLAILSYHALERPVMTLRRKFRLTSHP